MTGSTSVVAWGWASGWRESTEEGQEGTFGMMGLFYLILVKVK